MARIRTVKPEFWIDEKVVELSMAARLLFIGLWNFADDQGYVDDKPRRIKMQVFPGDSIEVEPLLAELVAGGLLARFDSPIGPVLHIRNWDKHQKVDRAAARRFDPAHLTTVSTDMNGSTSSQVKPPREDSSNVREDSLPSLDAEGKGSGSGSGRDLDLEGEPAPRPDASRSGAPPTVTQRSKRITDAYAAVEPMSKWPAVNGIVIKAIKTERWTDEEIRAALLRMAAEKRPVTVDSLRVELDGLPPSNSVRGSPRLVEHNGLRLKPETVANLQGRERFAAMDAAAIEGPQP